MMTDERDRAYVASYLADAARAVGEESLFLYPSGSAELPKVGVLFGTFQTRELAIDAMGGLPDNLRRFRPYVRSVVAVRSDVRKKAAA